MSRHTVVPEVGLFPIRNGKILLSLRQNTGYMDGYYHCIAGHVEANEGPVQAMLREAKEEGGLDLQPSDIRLVHVMQRKGPTDERVAYFFVLENVTQEPMNMEPEKCAGFAWFDLLHLPENMVDYVRAIASHVQTGQTFSEFGYEHQRELVVA